MMSQPNRFIWEIGCMLRLQWFDLHYQLVLVQVKLAPILLSIMGIGEPNFLHILQLGFIKVVYKISEGGRGGQINLLFGCGGMRWVHTSHVRTFTNLVRKLRWSFPAMPTVKVSDQSHQVSDPFKKKTFNLRHILHVL